MPNNHIKPTTEELAADEQRILSEAEQLAETPVVEEEEIVEEKPEETPETVEEVEPSEEDKTRLKEKLSASARENQRIYAKNRVINKAILEAEDIPEPTEEELSKEYADWEVMSEFERTMAKETSITKRWRAKIVEAGNQASKIEKWNESVEQYVEDPETLIDNPGLEGNIEKFKKFASEPDNNSVPMKILVSAFLHENSTGKLPNKGKMFDTGTGGPNDKPVSKDGKITVEEGRKIRESDYGKWKQMLNAGLIQSDF